MEFEEGALDSNVSRASVARVGEFEMLKPLMKRDPKVDTFNVAHSTAHRISAGKAA
jgi:hypothetical protein